MPLSSSALCLAIGDIVLGEGTQPSQAKPSQASPSCYGTLEVATRALRSEDARLPTVVKRRTSLSSRHRYQDKQY